MSPPLHGLSMSKYVKYCARGLDESRSIFREAQNSCAFPNKKAKEGKKEEGNGKRDY